MRKRNLNEERERVVRCNTITSKESENSTREKNRIPVWKTTIRFIYSGVVVVKKKKLDEASLGNLIQSLSETKAFFHSDINFK